MTTSNAVPLIAEYQKWLAEYKGIRVEVRAVVDGTATIYPNSGNPIRDLYCKIARVPLTELKATE